MQTPSTPRSISISADERRGWSSDAPRRDGAPPRPANIAARCRVLAPAKRLRYSPGSLLVIVSPSAVERERFAERLIENRAFLLSLGTVRGLLAGRVPEEEIEARAGELLDAAVAKRLEASESVVVTVEGLAPDERDRFARPAALLKRPRHVILLETSRDQVDEEDRAALNELRRRLDAGELGAEGFQTALRLSAKAAGEVKGIVFQSAPRES